MGIVEQWGVLMCVAVVQHTVAAAVRQIMVTGLLACVVARRCRQLRVTARQTQGCALTRAVLLSTRALLMTKRGGKEIKFHIKH